MGKDLLRSLVDGITEPVDLTDSDGLPGRHQLPTLHEEAVRHWQPPCASQHIPKAVVLPETSQRKLPRVVCTALGSSPVVSMLVNKKL